MTKFYMTKAPLASDDIEPIAVNLDNVLYINPFDEGALFRMVDGKAVYVAEKYEDVIKNITPFVPFSVMVNDVVRSDWMRKYISTTRGEKIADNNNG